MVAFRYDEVRERIDEMLERASRGESIAIERDGRVLARVVPGDPPAPEPRTPEEQAEVRAAIRALRKHAESVEPPVTEEDILRWIREGRRY